ncbi:MAG: DUF448 domain-containing protein [Candidatus Tectimicrobiota bacterium]
MSRRTHTAQRTCIGCRAVRPPHELIRLVSAPDGEVVIDLDRRLPGRGAHVCPTRRCLEGAAHKNVLGRAFRRRVTPVQASALAEALHRRLEEKLSGLLGLGQRARQVLSGRMALEKGLHRGEVHLLVLATDLAPDQRARWLTLYESSGGPWVVHFTKDQLGALLGKGLRGAAGITNPKLAQTVRRVASMLHGLEDQREGVRMHGNNANL